MQEIFKNASTRQGVQSAHTCVPHDLKIVLHVLRIWKLYANLETMQPILRLCKTCIILRSHSFWAQSQDFTCTISDPLHECKESAALRLLSSTDSRGNRCMHNECVLVSQWGCYGYSRTVACTMRVYLLVSEVAMAAEFIRRNLLHASYLHSLDWLLPSVKWP